MQRYDVSWEAVGLVAGNPFGAIVREGAHLLIAEGGAMSSLTSLDRADLRHHPTNFFVILFVRGHAKSLLNFVRYEDADACVYHDADTNVHSSPRRKTSVPSPQMLVPVRERVEV
ncbi:hypothetical protein SVAN01_06605 [Stagonosporopsis vannaccii]|nr:hypothetical protein SVAN01_06605 [Stagonosporopsis vannaccii]